MSNMNEIINLFLEYVDYIVIAALIVIVIDKFISNKEESVLDETQRKKPWPR